MAMYIVIKGPGSFLWHIWHDAQDACIFEIERTAQGVILHAIGRDLTLTEADLAFDHKDIIAKGLERLQSKVTYTDLALELLRNKEKFSIYELQIIHEVVTGTELDVANFRRSFKKKFIDTGRVEKLDEKLRLFQKTKQLL